jgi:hypothetical protein
MRFLTIFFLLLIYHNTSAMSLLQTRDCDTILFKNGRVFYAWVLDTMPGNIRYWDYGESFDKPLKVCRVKRIDSIKKGKASNAQNGITMDKQDRNPKKKVDWERVMSKWSLIASYTSLLALLLAFLSGGLFGYFLFVLVAAFGLVVAFMGFFKSKDDPTKFKLFRRSKYSFYPFIFFALLLAYMINKFVFFY